MKRTKDELLQLLNLMEDGIVLKIDSHTFENADLAGIDFSQIDVSNICFDGTDLSYCTFAGSLLGCTFKDAVFHDTDMRAVVLHEDNLSKTQLSGIFFLDEDYSKSFSKGDAS